MNYKYLNQMIEYIEQHLTEKIEYKQLAKIVGVNEFILQRVFVFMTDITLTEYIKKRRLSKAFEEIRNTDQRIIDIAVKYQYDSSISFGRAFKNRFHITPTEVRKKDIPYQHFPIIKFDNYKELGNHLNYKIENVDEIIFYYLEVKDKNHEDFLYKIRKLYQELEDKGLYREMKSLGLYALVTFEKDMFKYKLGCKKQYPNTKREIIPKGKYAIFEVELQNQKAIMKTSNMIYKRWFPSTDYILRGKYDFELYKDNNCYIYVPIEDKQN